MNRICRRLVLRKLAQLDSGSLVLCDPQLPNGQRRFGVAAAGPSARLVVHHPRLYRRVVLGGDLGAAESLVDGDFSCDDLTSMVRVFIRNMPVTHQVGQGTAWLRQLGGRLMHWLRRNTTASARRNIAKHYDLGNEFYALWLDKSMNYSSGILQQAGDSLLQASTAKMDRACRQLDLGPQDHLLEIGTGWGALAIHAAQHYGCRVTTTTISEEQYKFASRRVHRAGLSDRVAVLNKDYRALHGKFDKLVSIEMIEAVGHQYYPTFFAKCGELLAADGRMLLQAIVIADECYQQHIRSVDFISQYIFPGGSLPALSVLTGVAAQAAGMRVLAIHDFAPHYAETLRRWRANFEGRLGRVRQLGFDERFIRLWRYYLCYCEAAFEERQVNVVQMMLAKRGSRVDQAGVFDSESAAAQPPLPVSPAAVDRIVLPISGAGQRAVCPADADRCTESTSLWRLGLARLRHLGDCHAGRIDRRSAVGQVPP